MIPIEILILNAKQDLEPSQTCEDEKKERVKREEKNLPELENDSGTGIPSANQGRKPI